VSASMSTPIRLVAQIRDAARSAQVQIAS